MLVGFLAGGCALVYAATETSRPLLRSVLADTVVRRRLTPRVGAGV